MQLRYTISLMNFCGKNKYVGVLRIFLLLMCVLYFPMSQAAVSVIDDAGNTVSLKQPAKRIISLAPHVTELLYAIGAGDSIVGTVEYSDFPPPAKKLTRVGSHNALDLERIIALKPDLVVVWQSGTVKSPVEKFGIPF